MRGRRGRGRGRGRGRPHIPQKRPWNTTIEAQRAAAGGWRAAATAVGGGRSRQLPTPFVRRVQHRLLVNMLELRVASCELLSLANIMRFGVRFAMIL